MNFNSKEEIIALTPLWTGERMDDGRPYVADKYLKELHKMTLEEVWKPIFVKGYTNQFVGGGVNPLNVLHDDGRKLIGRAVTCTLRRNFYGTDTGVRKDVEKGVSLQGVCD